MRHYALQCSENIAKALITLVMPLQQGSVKEIRIRTSQLGWLILFQAAIQPQRSRQPEEHKPKQLSSTFGIWLVVLPGVPGTPARQSVQQTTPSSEEGIARLCTPLHTTKLSCAQTAIMRVQ